MATLQTLKGEPWPNLGGWLVSQGEGANCTPLQHAIVLRALQDDGILETPLGSNRGVRIDRYTRRAGLPVPKDKKTGEGWWWCAIWAGAVFADCGAQIPVDYPACDRWLPFLEPTPCIGAAVLYGVRGDAAHIGIIARISPLMLSVEGNRSYAGTVSNNGVAVDLGPVIRRDILGYFHPRKADGTR